jgi:hypothetical protein
MLILGLNYGDDGGMSQVSERVTRREFLAVVRDIACFTFEETIM